ncbi:MAG: hypothetical protein SGI90_14840 [Candidatus Eisenbacteria bacterium]|nr:hypothetical protein [Candidatus Eisenbacteria bacterium]
MPSVPAAVNGTVRFRIVRIARFWLLATMASIGLCLVAAIRVGRIDPTLVRAGSVGVIALPLLVVAAAGILIGVLLDQIIGRLGDLGRLVARRMRPDQAPPSPAILETTRVDVTMALIALAGSWTAFKWLAIPLTIPGRGAVSVPMIAASAGPLLIPLSIGLGLEAVLGLARLIVGESGRWWFTRALLRLSWIAFAVIVIAGPNLLIGDPLEWASRIGPSPLSVEWLEAAPRAMAAGWPLAQIALAGMLVWQLLTLIREVPRVWRRS